MNTRSRLPFLDEISETARIASKAFSEKNSISCSASFFYRNQCHFLIAGHDERIAFSCISVKPSYSGKTLVSAWHRPIAFCFHSFKIFFEQLPGWVLEIIRLQSDLQFDARIVKILVHNCPVCRIFSKSFNCALSLSFHIRLNDLDAFTYPSCSALSLCEQPLFSMFSVIYITCLSAKDTNASWNMCIGFRYLIFLPSDTIYL